MVKKVHVVVGFYGMLLQDLQITKTKKKVREIAKTLCKEYDIPYRDVSRAKPHTAYHLSKNEENEVHIWFDQPIKE